MQATFLMPKSINNDIVSYTKTLARAKKRRGRFSNELMQQIDDLPLGELVVRVEKKLEINADYLAALQPNDFVRVGRHRYKIKERVFGLASESLEILLEQEHNNYSMVSVLSSLLRFQGFSLSITRFSEPLEFLIGGEKSAVYDYIVALRLLSSAVEKAEEEYEALEEVDEDSEAA